MKLETKRFYVLDAFRGLSALLVFLYHMPEHSFLTKNSFVVNSGFFVDLFFILSGFVIYHNYKDKDFNYNYSKYFIRRRFNRLVPLHIYTLLILVLLEVIKLLTLSYIDYTDLPFTTHNFSNLLPQLFLLNSTPFFTGFQWNGPNWSVSAEVISYIIFAFTSFLWIKNNQKKILISVSLVVFGYLFFYLKFGNFNLSQDFNYAFIRGFTGFFLGVLCYLSVPYFQKILRTTSTIFKHVLELLSVLLIILFIINFTPNEYYFLHLAFSLLIMIFSLEQGCVSSFLKLSLFQKLGLWSYSIYLNQNLAIRINTILCEKILKIEGSWYLFFEVLTLVTLCLYSYYTYQFIEKRFIRRKNVLK